MQDFSQFRSKALGAEADEERVTVNTRALIDGVLARYPGEWTTLRELIQNAADAQATKVSIQWKTLPTQEPIQNTSEPSELLKRIKYHKLSELIVTNNGAPFSDTDWARLKCIAQGNPDESKIGAFGVGFYSVFADCEEPFVVSGNKTMEFSWKDDALFTQTRESVKKTPGTALILKYRNIETQVPNLLSVSQFLATCLLAPHSLQEIELWIDKYKVLTLRKNSLPVPNISENQDLLERDLGFMKLSSVERAEIQIDATAMDIVGWNPEPLASADDISLGSSQSSSLSDKIWSAIIAYLGDRSLESTSRSKIRLRQTSAVITTSLNEQLAIGLKRRTKKQPPEKTQLTLLTSLQDEIVKPTNSAVSNNSPNVTEIFASILPSDKLGGRIFIGFPTMQTTGAGMHISSSSFIPTVEREALDLNAPPVDDWNIKLLEVAGTMSCMAFNDAMSNLENKLKRKSNSSASAEDIAQFLPEALSLLETYTFTKSTPLLRVAWRVERAFWAEYERSTPRVYSSKGVLPASTVRFGSDEHSRFVDGIPVILRSMRKMQFIEKVRNISGMLQDISIDDVRDELKSKPLSIKQAKAFIAWLGKPDESGKLDANKTSLLDSAVVGVGNRTGHDSTIALRDIKHYVPTEIPPNLPIPPTCLPSIFTTSTSIPYLEALGWQPLEIVPWLQFLIASESDKENPTKSPEVAIKILKILSRKWDHLSRSLKDSVVDTLKSVTAIPTKKGMKKPEESYFQSVTLFRDLPTVYCDDLQENLLSDLGVRKTVCLEMIFERLFSSNSKEKRRQKWSHMELIKYLASVQDNIPAGDIEKLKESPRFPAEGEINLFKLSELFEPDDRLRTLKLPILQWHGMLGSYITDSIEARFLSCLGLRKYPSVPELVNMMASRDSILRNNARQYFIEYYQINRYEPLDEGSAREAILPMPDNENILVPPSTCCTHGGAAVLGYNILRKDLHEHAHKFRVPRDPPIADCIHRLVSKPPLDSKTAVAIFEYFTSRLDELRMNKDRLASLRDALIVPLVRRGRLSSANISPEACYIGNSSKYGPIFDFVDFGKSANLFLSECGAKDQPTASEIAQLVCEDPRRLLNVLKSPRKYIDLLLIPLAKDAEIQANEELLKKMQSSPFLLGWKQEAPPENGMAVLEGNGAPIRNYILAAPREIVILDDMVSYSLFKDCLTCAPEDDLLEKLYDSLGSQKLSGLVEDRVKAGPNSSDQAAGIKLMELALERSKIFLSDLNDEGISIKHDTKWLEKHLRIEVVQSVTVHLSLRGGSKSRLQKRSAACVHIYDEHILYISTESRPDMYQVAQILCQLLLTRSNQQLYSHFESFLVNDLSVLRARGYNVDRMLREKEPEAKIPEEEMRKGFEDKQYALHKPSTSPSGISADRTSGTTGFPPTPPASADIYTSRSYNDWSTHQMPGQSSSYGLEKEYVVSSSSSIPSNAPEKPPRPSLSSSEATFNVDAVAIPLERHMDYNMEHGSGQQSSQSSAQAPTDGNELVLPEASTGKTIAGNIGTAAPKISIQPSQDDEPDNLSTTMKAEEESIHRGRTLSRHDQASRSPSVSLSAQYIEAEDHGRSSSSVRSTTARTSYAHSFINMDKGWITVPPSRTIFSNDDTEDTRYFGELYVSRYLESLLGKKGYQPENHWTSTVRFRSGIPRYTTTDDDTSTFTIKNVSGAFRDAIIKCEYISSNALADYITVHIDVSSTEEELGSHFGLLSSQYEKLKKLRLQDKRAAVDVYILARVYRVWDSPGIAMFADPWQLEQDGHIAFNAVAEYTGYIGKSTPVALEERLASVSKVAKASKIYDGLPVGAGQIRLLKLQHVDDDNMPLTGSLEIADVADLKLEGGFWAISYSWGPQPKGPNPSTFTTEKGTIPITESLSSCLKCLRRKRVDARIWADALCINQRDDLEKKIQVRRMGSIYDKAARVIIWLGADGGIDQPSPEVEWLADIHKPLCSHDNRCHTILASPAVNLDAPEETDERWVGINEFLKRRWFTRAWVIQELVLAGDVSIMSGRSEIKWDCFMESLLECHRQLNSFRDGNENAAGRAENSVFLKSSEAAIALHKTRQLYQSANRKLKFLELLEMFAYTNSSLPRDKMFSLLNLAVDSYLGEKEFDPDYSSADEVVIENYARGFVRNDAVLELLYHAGVGKSASFCSWIPNWIPNTTSHGKSSSFFSWIHNWIPSSKSSSPGKTPRTYPPTISTWRTRRGEDGHFHAGRSGKVQAEVRSNPSVATVHPPPILAIRGYIIDEIRDDCLELGLDSGPSIAFAKALQNVLGYISSLNGYPHIDDDDGDANSLGAGRKLKDRLLLRLLVGDAKGPYIRPESAVQFPSLDSEKGDQRRKAPSWPIETGAEVLSLDLSLDAHGYGKKSPDTQARLMQYWQTAWTFVSNIPNAALCMTRNRRAADKPYIGIVPGEAKAGDHIFVANGARVPFVLRKVADTPYYTLIGECYIHGIMYGAPTSFYDEKDTEVCII